MRILIVHRYFWPDQAPCAGIMRWIAKHLADDGYSVDVLTSQPSYRTSSSLERHARVEFTDGVSVTRLNLPTEAGRPVWRIINAIHLGILLLFKAVIKRYDVIIVAAVPPVLGGLFSALAAKIIKARLIYYCMDLHPEIGGVSGDFSNPFLFYLLQRLDDWTCQQANPVLVHSDDMRNTLKARRNGGKYNVQIMNNFALPSEDKPLSCSDLNVNFSNNRLTLIYAGNLGRFQGLETVIDAMGLIANRKDIQLIFMGEGIVKSTLVEMQLKTGANVQFLGYQPVEVAKEVIRQSDIGLITLIPEVYKYAYPSKTMIYLEQGRPIIAAIESESELVKTMTSEGYGFSTSIGDANMIAELIIRLADDQSWKTTMSHAARKAFEKYFSASIVLAKWSNLVRT